MSPLGYCFTSKGYNTSELCLFFSCAPLILNYLHSQFSIGPSWWHQPWMLGDMWHECKSPDCGLEQMKCKKKKKKMQLCWVIIIQLKVMSQVNPSLVVHWTTMWTFFCRHERTVKSTFVFECHRPSSLRHRSLLVSLYATSFFLSFCSLSFFLL